MGREPFAAPREWPGHLLLEPYPADFPRHLRSERSQVSNLAGRVSEVPANELVCSDGSEGGLGVVGLSGPNGGPNPSFCGP